MMDALTAVKKTEAGSVRHMNVAKLPSKASAFGPSSCKLPKLVGVT